MFKKLKLLVLCSFLTLGFTCNPANEWNSMFNRGTLVSDSRGWVSGDAALMTQLPDGRFLWAFGDSRVSRIDTSNNTLIVQNPLSRDGVFGTILAIQNSPQPHPNAIRFFARDFSNLAVKDITSGVPSIFTVEGRSLSFFSEPILQVPDITPDTQSIFWPHGLSCINCDKQNAQVIINLTEVVFCNPQNSIYDCRPFCVLNNAESGNQTPPEECTSGIANLRKLLVKVLNPDYPIEDWEFQSIIVEQAGGTNWGVDFLERYGWVYVYGTDEVEGVPGEFNMVVARTLQENVMVPDEWEVLTEQGWVKKSENPTPRVAAKNVTTMLSVDSIISNGRENFLLVHDRPLRTHLTFLRTSGNQTQWPDLSTNTVRVDKLSADFTLQESISSAIALGNCNPPFLQIVTAYACVPSYHGSVYKEMSIGQQIGSGLKTLFFGFIVPRGPSDGTNSANYDKPRFGTIDIEKVAPWCKITTKCWRGVNHVYPALALNVGETKDFNFDVTHSSSFVLELFETVSLVNVETFADFVPTPLDVTCEFDSNTESTFCILNNLEDINVITLRLSSAEATQIITFRVSYNGLQGTQ